MTDTTQRQLTTIDGQPPLRPTNLDRQLTPAAAGIRNTSRGLRLETMQDAVEFARMVVSSNIAPQHFKKPEQIIIAVQLGAEVGLAPMQSLQNIAVINGRACLWGDALKALVEASPHCEYVRESFDEQTMTATCEAKRKGRPEPHTATFSMVDAERANLANKGPWKQYPKRMLQMRARAFALRDQFPDLLCGLAVAEEAQDYQAETTIEDGATIEVGDAADEILGDESDRRKAKGAGQGDGDVKVEAQLEPHINETIEHPKEAQPGELFDYEHGATE